MTTNIGGAIGAGIGLLITAKIAGAVINEAEKINGKESKKSITKQSEIRSLP